MRITRSCRACRLVETAVGCLRGMVVVNVLESGTPCIPTNIECLSPASNNETRARVQMNSVFGVLGLGWGQYRIQ